MGVYAVSSNGIFRARNGSIKMKRKRGMIDRNGELIRIAHLEFDAVTQSFRLVKDEQSESRRASD